MSTASPRDIIAPCPFCGGTANVYTYECQDPFVGCNGGRGDVACDANGPSMPTEAEAIARWNRRTPAAGYRVVREGGLDAAIAALEFYANPENYKEQLVTADCGCCSYWVDPKIGKDGEDTGAVATAALRALVGEAK